MSSNSGLNRRAFLQNAGMTAVLGAVGSGTPLVAAAAGAAQAPAAKGKFDFDTPYNRLGTDSVKWDGPIASGGTDGDHLVAGMGIADMDFRCAPAITQALQERIKHEVWGYLTMPKAFSEGIIAWNKRRYNVDVDPSMLDITTGVHPGLIAALRAFSPPGTKVLLMTPTYNGFYGDLRNTGTLPEESPMKFANGRFEIDFEDLERRMNHTTNSLILCNPQNPTGNCWSRADLTKLGEICLKRRVVVLADEIHCDWVTKGQKYTPFATLDKEIVNNSLTFKAASKSFGLAAMKCAWYFSTNKDYFAATKANNRPDLSTLGMIASQSAYAGGEDWLNQCIDYVDGNHDLVQSFVKANMPLVKVGAKPEGTYLVWLDVTGVMEKIGAKAQAEAATKSGGRPVTADTIVERWFTKSAGVAMNAGPSYGLGGANHMRMNIATSRKTLQAALTSMANALKSTATA